MRSPAVGNISRPSPREYGAPQPHRRRWYRRLPLAYWACMVIAAANAGAWALITPTFQVPDEPPHAAYTEFIAETGRIPRDLVAYYTPAPDANITFASIPFSLGGKPSWSPVDNRSLQRELARSLGRISERGAGYEANNPPLYYALEAVPYRIAHSGSFLDRLYAMRFFSALLAGLTVGFVFLFLRELLPRSRLVWTVGALAVAFQPVFAFIGGGVNNDNLLWTATAAELWLIARAFRRGLTVRLGLGIGIAVAAGLLTKGSTFGLLPGTILGLVLMVWRAPRLRRRSALTGMGAAILAAALPMGAWLAVNQVVVGRSSGTTTSGVTSIPASLSGQLSYLWQFFLPRLPFMYDWFAGYPQYPLWQTYFQGFVGRFGWFQYGFPLWATELALAIFAVIVALAATELLRRRAALLARWAEALTYLTLAVGLILLVAVAGYRYRVSTGLNFEQSRYLFPLISLYGAVIALAARGAGKRWTPALGVFLVVLALGHNLFAQLLTLARYYS
jgi:4-amino-4-deoxy-L-arabinose transferase-like glycosyltransferase